MQEGNACLPTAAAMALHALGTPTNARDIARRMPVYPDGSDFFDLQEELTRRGFESLVFTGGPEVVAAALRAEVPVVAAVKRGAAKHAVLVWGVPQGEEPALAYLDPADGTERRVGHAEFEAMQYARQLLIVWPAGTPPHDRLEAAGFPRAAAEKVDARFRSEALLRRADRHLEPNLQVVELLERAVREDPGWEAPRRRLEAVRAELARSEPKDAP